jgi:hypothetical protein
MNRLARSMAPRNPLYDPSPDHTNTETTIIGQALQQFMHDEHNNHLRMLELIDEAPSPFEGWHPWEVAQRKEDMRREHYAKLKEIDRLRRRYIIDPIELVETFMWNEHETVNPQPEDPSS